MRFLLDLQDTGETVKCRDAEQAAALGSLWRTTLEVGDAEFAAQIAARIRAIAGSNGPSPLDQRDGKDRDPI